MVRDFSKRWLRLRDLQRRSFGTEVIKVGMTRRLEPLDRVRELGDASVPFRFDVHALLFSKVRQHLLELTGELLQFEDAPEALEYHQSLTEAQVSQGS